MANRLDPVRLGLLGLRQANTERSLGLEGVHVWQEGHEPAGYRWMPDERHDVYSVSKTFVAVAVGLAIDEGLVTLDAPVLSCLPELAPAAAPGVESITVRHLLGMTAGIDWRWDDPDVDHPGDAAQDFLSTPPVAAPGERHLYRGTNSYLLSRVIAAASGLDLRDYLMPRLFEPPGIRNPQWLRCPLGYSIGALGLQLRTEEVARLGRTLLDGGRWAGRQVVPAAWVDEMHEPALPTGRPEPDNQFYALHCWHCARDDAWRMDGLYGQFSVVLPRHRACVTVTAHYERNTVDILDALWSELIDHLDRP